MTEPYRLGSPARLSVQRLKSRRLTIAAARTKAQMFSRGVMTKAEVAVVENRMPLHCGTGR